MAESADAGVTNHKGQVYLANRGSDVHSGLYIIDASVVPRSLGVNPRLTISALAERTCDHIANDHQWVIDYAFRKNNSGA